MKKLSFCATLFFLSLVPTVFAQNPVKVTVSILPQKYFVEKIGGAFVDVQVMVPRGADPHTFEPKPRQMLRLAESSLYFATGVDFEVAWLDRFHSLNKNLSIADMSTGIVKLTSQDRTHQEADHAHELSDAPHYDPHIWLSPSLAKVQIAFIRDSLAKVLPQQAETFEENYRQMLADIEALDQNIQSLFETLPEEPAKRTFITAHAAWQYFAKDYGLEEISVTLNGKEPKPKDMALLVDKAKAYGIKTIFVEPQFSAKSAKALAASIHGEVLRLNPLAENWQENLLESARLIAKSLS